MLLTQSYPPTPFPDDLSPPSWPQTPFYRNVLFRSNPVFVWNAGNQEIKVNEGATRSFNRANNKKITSSSRRQNASKHCAF